jgi:hypothetical protein
MALENIGFGVVVCFSVQNWQPMAEGFWVSYCMIYSYYWDTISLSGLGCSMHRAMTDFGVTVKRRYVRGFASIYYLRLCMRAGS